MMQPEHYVCKDHHAWVCHWAKDIPLWSRWDCCEKCMKNGNTETYLPLKCMKRRLEAVKDDAASNTL